MTENSMTRKKGPLVWLDMDQKELDDAYDQSVYAPNQQLIATRRRVASEAMLKRITPERVAYGSSEDERLDIYKTTRADAPPFTSARRASEWSRHPSNEVFVKLAQSIPLAPMGAAARTA